MKVEHELMHRIISNYRLAVIPNFFIGAFECDLFVMNKNLYTVEYEIKKTLADYKNDFKKEKKYFNYREQAVELKNKHTQIQAGKRTNRFYFVLEKGMGVEVPAYAGLMVYEVGKYGITFAPIKTAPLLTKNKASVELIKTCLCKLTWRYYAGLHTIERLLEAK